MRPEPRYQEPYSRPEQQPREIERYEPDPRFEFRQRNPATRYRTPQEDLYDPEYNRNVAQYERQERYRGTNREPERFQRPKPVPRSRPSSRRTRQPKTFAIQERYTGLASHEEKVYAQLLADYGHSVAEEYKESLST